MGRGSSAGGSTDILYGETEPRRAAVIDTEGLSERCVIVATMFDAATVEDAILHNPDLVPDLDHIKVPTADVMEITINASEEEARRQLTHAVVMLDTVNTVDHVMGFSIDEVHQL